MVCLVVDDTDMTCSVNYVPQHSTHSRAPGFPVVAFRFPKELPGSGISDQVLLGERLIVHDPDFCFVQRRTKVMWNETHLVVDVVSIGRDQHF